MRRRAPGVFENFINVTELFTKYVSHAHYNTIMVS